MYRNTSSMRPTSVSTSRGTARSIISIGRWRLAFSALSTMPLPMIGRGLAVQVTMMSCPAMTSARSFNCTAFPRSRTASSSARSSVRLAKVMLRGCCAPKCVAVSSIISPAPMNRIFCSATLGKIRPASRTAAAAIDTELAPISVRLRTSFATEKVC